MKLIPMLSINGLLNSSLQHGTYNEKGQPLNIQEHVSEVRDQKHYCFDKVVGFRNCNFLDELNFSYYISKQT